MATIVMAVFDTEENERSEYTDQTMISLLKTVDFNKHRLIVVDNNSCALTKRLLERYKFITDGMTIITNPTNVGTARAINQGIKLRRDGENVVKIDNDVVIHSEGWVDEMEEAIRRDPTIGVLGLKRKDLRQSVHDPDPNFRSEYVELPHVAGERWITVEATNDIMGTCTMLNSALLDKVGGFFQGEGNTYGFDDNLMCLRSKLAGFYNAFLSHISIEHIDRGDNPYVQVKHQQAAKYWGTYMQLHEEYCNGSRPIYYDGGFTE